MQTNVIHQINHLFKREIKAEWQNRYALMSIVMLLVISVFIVYTIDRTTTDAVWHSYFYILLIFGVVQNIGRSFLTERKGIHLYYRTMVDNRALLLAKTLYQLLVNALFIVFLFLVMNFFLPQTIPHLWEYLVTVGLFTMCNVSVFTFNAAIAMNAKNSAIVASILSFPLLLPSLIISLKSASKAQLVIENVSFYQDWLVLFLLWSITVVLGVVLFRYVWSE